MEEWKEYKLGEVCTIVGRIGFRGYTTDDLTNNPKDGAITLSPTNIVQGEIDLSKPTYIKWPKYYESPEIMLNPSDIVLVKTGSSIGRTAYIRRINHPMTLNPQFVVLKNISVNPIFLAYVIKTPLFQALLKSITVGSAIPTLSQKNLGNLIIHIPNDDYQSKVASILKSLDDMIEVNRRINDNLEQQVQALFKSWFVDFEPFRDGGFVESELGLIPKGWRVGTLGEICSQSSLKVGSRNDVKVLSPVTTGNLMLSEEYFTKQVFSESIVKYKVVKKGAFAYNPARVNIGSLGRNEYDFDGAVSPVYVVFECKEGYSNFFDLFRTTERFKTEVLLRSIGGVRQSLNYVDFAMIQTIIAPKDVVDAFNPIMEEIQVMQKHLAEENDRLATLRDTLLPKLMSGELKVFDKPNDQS